jgi:hypothetical protein
LDRIASAIGWAIFIEGHHGEISQELLIAIIGRNYLDKNLWQTYEGVTGHMPLEPFSEGVAKLFRS